MGTATAHLPDWFSFSTNCHPRPDVGASSRTPIPASPHPASHFPYHSRMPIEAYDRGLEHARAAMPRSMWRRRADTTLAPLPGGIRMAVLTSPFIVRWAAWLVAVLIIFVADVPRLQPALRAVAAASARCSRPRSSRSTCRRSGPWLLPRLRRFFATPENSDVLALGLIDLALSMVRRVPERRLGQPVLPLRADGAAHPVVLPHVPRRAWCSSASTWSPTSSA